MGSPLDEPQPLRSRPSISQPPVNQSRLSKLLQLPSFKPEIQEIQTHTSRLAAPAPLISAQPTRILDFDLETVAAGFADPEYVPQKITCCSWSWIGSDVIESRIATPAGIFGNPSLRREMLAALLAEIRQADLLVGQNIEWFDLPIINAECMRLGLEPVRSVLVQDTKRLFRSKGFKKGQDNLCDLFQTEERKMAMNWQQWQDAYDEDQWLTIRQRCESDVKANKQLREKLLKAGYLRSPRRWVGFS